MDYYGFLKQKRIRTTTSGLLKDHVNLHDFLFPFQREIVKRALLQGKYAVFADCGLGKTPISLSWADNIVKTTGGKVLILAPLAVSQQTQQQGVKFGIHVNIAKSQGDITPGINITNYERIDKFDFSEFTGLVLDESSILRNYTGKIKKSIILKSAHIPFKLSCTATPAPNDYTELLNQAEFLDVMTSGQALTLWFVNDTTQANNLRLKHHAQDVFWEWVSSWAVYVSKPSDLGDTDKGFILPDLHVQEHVLPVSYFNFDREDGCFLRDVKMSATAYNREKKHTLPQRTKRTVELARQYMQQDEQVLIWCERNYEADALKKELPEAIEIRGNHTPEMKQQAAIDFVSGKISVLISKPSIFGYGLNFQNCRRAIFNGLSFSYEAYYQAVRRLYRFMQTQEVYIDIVYGESEKQVIETVQRKEAQHVIMQEEMFKRLKYFQQQPQDKYNLSYPHNEAMSIPTFLTGRN